MKWLNPPSGNMVEKKDVTISLTNEDGTQLFVTWVLVNAFPTASTAPSLDAASNEVVLHQVTLHCDRLTVQTH